MDFCLNYSHKKLKTEFYSNLMIVNKTNANDVLRIKKREFNKLMIAVKVFNKSFSIFTISQRKIEISQNIVDSMVQ